MTNLVKEPTRTPGQSSRDLIFQKALQLFTDRGYDGTSIDDIRQATGFKSKASFYTHFKSKEELSNALLTKILEDEARITTNAFQTAPAEPLAQFLSVGRAFIRWGLTNPKEYAFCFLRTQQEMLIRGSYSDEAEQSNDAIKYLIGRMRVQYPVRKITNDALTSMLVGLISKAVIDQSSFGKLPVEDKIEQIVEMCLGVLFSEKVQY
jgi:AcrR family transcriptional regulator